MIDELSSSKGIYRASRDGFLEKVRRYISLGGDVNYRYVDGDTPLIVACITNRSRNIVRLLLDQANLDVNSSDPDGMTALMWVSRYNHVEIAKLLLFHKDVDVNIGDCDGRTALMWACQYKHLDIVRLLVSEPGIDLGEKDNNGETALNIAEDNGCKKIMSMLKTSIENDCANESKPESKVQVLPDPEKAEQGEGSGKPGELGDDQLTGLAKNLRDLHAQKLSHEREMKNIEERNRIEKEKLENRKRVEVVEIEERTKKEIERLEEKGRKEREELERKEKIAKEETENKDRVEREKLESTYQKEVREMYQKQEANRCLYERGLRDLIDEELTIKRRIRKLLGDDEPYQIAPLPECPICFEGMGPPKRIFHCTNGHNVCGDCQPKLQQCYCRAIFIGRAIGFESFLRDSK